MLPPYSARCRLYEQTRETSLPLPPEHAAKPQPKPTANLQPAAQDLTQAQAVIYALLIASKNSEAESTSALKALDIAYRPITNRTAPIDQSLKVATALSRVSQETLCAGLAATFQHDDQNTAEKVELMNLLCQLIGCPAAAYVRQ